MTSIHKGHKGHKKQFDREHISYQDYLKRFEIGEYQTVKNYDSLY